MNDINSKGRDIYFWMLQSWTLLVSVLDCVCYLMVIWITSWKQTASSCWSFCSVHRADYCPRRCLPSLVHPWCMHFSVQLKNQFLEKEVQLISSPFGLPENEKSTSRGIFAQQKEKQNSEMCIPFACFLNKIKNKFRHAYHGCLVKLVHACLTAKKVR